LKLTVARTSLRQDKEAMPSLAQPMIQGAEPTKTFNKVFALIPLFLFLGCTVLKIGGAGETQAILNPATNMIQPLRAQLQHAEARAFTAAAAGLRAQHLATRPAALKARAYASAMHWAARDGARVGCRGQSTCVRAVGLFFGTSTGKTEEAADFIASAAGLEAKSIDDVGEAKEFEGFDGIIAGVPTWNTGADEARSSTAWDDMLDDIRGLDLCGKPVAIYGLGDQVGYGDNFCDAIEEMHSTFEAAGAKMIGYTDSGGYEDFSDSKSVKDGKFLGLPLDGDNEPDKSEDRVKRGLSSSSLRACPLVRF